MEDEEKQHISAAFNIFGTAWRKWRLLSSHFQCPHLLIVFFENHPSRTPPLFAHPSFLFQKHL